MIQEQFLKLDDMAAPNGYTAPSTREDLAYIVHFRQMCKRYNIDFSSADQDEQDFILHMTEKSFYTKRA